MKCLLRDVEALQHMLREGLIESGRARIGAEQELFLVDQAWRASPCVQEVMGHLDGDPHFTTELGRFNLEFNLEAYPFEGESLRRMEEGLLRYLRVAREAAHRAGAGVVLAGILPTLRLEDLSLEAMTPVRRYKALNDAFHRLRGGVFRFRIKGIDELIIEHDSIMLEAANTSFQVHLQVGHEEFARVYNLAQVVAAPVLAAACNSPLLFGRRLWRETRIALFQQSVDTRKEEIPMRELQPRVSFGTRWVRESVLEIFQEDITRFRALIGTNEWEDPFDALAAGRAPQLHALRLFNGTVYRWNRPCYGISEGRPHLRIENRILPSGPTPFDEVSNAAFWLGLMKGLMEEYPDVTQHISFAAAKENLLTAATLGLDAQFVWLDGETWPARDLILSRLLPVARAGLEARAIAAADIDRYLGNLEERVRSRVTGAAWQLRSLAGMSEKASMSERLAALTAAMAQRQAENLPVHQWEPGELGESGNWREHYGTVEAFMTTDIFTVHQDDLVDLVTTVMDWAHIRHVPVEDDDHRLVGLLTHRQIMRHLAHRDSDEPLAVAEIMERNPVAVTPDTPTLEAIEIMRDKGISCLPVVKDGVLVGIVTEHDFMEVAWPLLQQKLREG